MRAYLLLYLRKFCKFQNKILLRYFKNDKLNLSLYIIFTILKYFEPLANAFIWASAFEALATNNQSEFIKYLILWSSVIIIAWVFVQLPTDLFYTLLFQMGGSLYNEDLTATNFTTEESSGL